MPDLPLTRVVTGGGADTVTGGSGVDTVVVTGGSTSGCVRATVLDAYQRAYSLDLAGDLRVELELEGQPSGLGWMPDGSLLVVRMELRAVWRRWMRWQPMPASRRAFAIWRCCAG